MSDSQVEMNERIIRKAVNIIMLTFFLNTSEERIAGIANLTTTNRIMVDDLATGINAAGSWTRIEALLADASQILRTVGADYALRPT